MGGSAGIGGGFLLFLALAYFVPAVIAMMRDHHGKLAIFVLNLLLGWTLLGCVAALVWSFTPVQSEAAPLKTDEYGTPVIADATKDCPRCAETVKSAATVCRFCGHEFEPVATDGGETAI